MESIIKNSERMFELTRGDDERLTLTVVSGGIGMVEVSVLLDEEEVERFNTEGEAFIEELAYKVAKEPSAYTSR